MQISTFTDYCLRILLFLAANPEKNISNREIADAYGISIHHAAKASKWLTRNGYVEAQRGKLGGLRLIKQPYEINLGVLVRDSSGDKTPINCYSKDGKPCLIHGACGLPGLLQKAKSAYFTELESYTLQDAMVKSVLLFETLTA